MNTNTHMTQTCRSSKLTLIQSKELILSVLNEVAEHLGRPALLFLKEGRKTTSLYVKIYSINKRGLIVVKHRCFSPTGELRCLISHCISASDLLSGCQKLVFFDDV